jgi:hypothetical protein
VLWRGKRQVHNRAGQLFRMAAYSLDRSPTPLGGYLRRMKAKLGTEGRTHRHCSQIAVIFYTMIKSKPSMTRPFGRNGTHNAPRGTPSDSTARRLD